MAAGIKLPGLLLELFVMFLQDHVAILERTVLDFDLL